MLVTIAVYNYIYEAHIAQSRLASYGIESYIPDENIGRVYPIAVGGIRLQVSQSDVQKARKILNEDES